MDLDLILRQPEGKTLEFKPHLSSPEGVFRTLVAFANTAGGIVLIGVEDGTRRVIGVENPLETEERLANLIADHIEPRLVPDIEILPWRRLHLIGVEVYPSPNRPHHLRRKGPEGGTYVRVGSTNRSADRELVAELRRYVLGESFDEQPLPTADASEVDFGAAKEAFSPVRRLERRDLSALRLLVRYQGRNVPSVGGVLLFGTTREQHFPDAWVQLGRFAGTDKSRIADHTEYRGQLHLAAEHALAFVTRNLGRSAEIEGVRRVDQWEIPLVAIREAIVNAVAHADYSQRGAPIRVALFDDRLEVENPGLLPFGLTVEDLRHGISRLRNRIVGRVFHELGLMEHWGSGIQRMTTACREAGLPDPEFEEIGSRFRVTLRSTAPRQESLDEVGRELLALLSDGEGHSTSEIARQIGRSARATRSRLVALIAEGMVREVGTGPRDPKRRYYLGSIR